MNEKFQYRLSTNQKADIAQNLIDILQNDINNNEITNIFIIYGI